ncbi:MAG: hypothetical protein J7494_12620 [Sphingobium sp.]|nr:hypothetical protein [Sphingobium sp.]
MMLSKLAFAAATLAIASAGGVALGGYTIGGFRIDQPADTLSALAAGQSAPDSSQAPGAPVLLTQGEPIHVCKGCDAKLYREDPGRYDPSAYAEPVSTGRYQGYKEQPARQDYAEEADWDAAITAYYDDEPDAQDEKPPVTLATIG